MGPGTIRDDGGSPSAGNGGVRRELDQVYQRLEAINRSIENERAITVDLQVRVAEMEAKSPVSRDEFDPIRRLVWGFVGTVLLAVIVALLALVLKSGVPLRP